MGFKCGIVGLPNVGKSTLFNALTQTAAAQAANYPFCTIEPNVGDVAVPGIRDFHKDWRKRSDADRVDGDQSDRSADLLARARRVNPSTRHGRAHP
jgi:hypothetical protein